MDNLSNLIIPKFLDEAITPVAKEAGDRLADVVNLIFTPLYMARKYKDIKIGLFFEKVEKKLKEIPEKNIMQPQLNIVGPALEYVAKYGYEEDYLQELFAQLIASSMDKNTNKSVHPSYVEIIKQLSCEDAALLSSLIWKELNVDKVHSLMPLTITDVHVLINGFNIVISECHMYKNKEFKVEYPSKSFRNSISNLHRLNIIRYLSSSDMREVNPKDINFSSDSQDMKYFLNDKTVNFTSFGNDFANSCISFD